MTMILAALLLLSDPPVETPSVPAITITAEGQCPEGVDVAVVCCCRTGGGGLCCNEAQFCTGNPPGCICYHGQSE